ncbi:MAG: hypothetical protein ACLSFE_07990, partial [Christensenellales bacterium]
LKASLCKILFERIICFETAFPIICKCIVADISITTITFAFEQKRDFRSTALAWVQSIIAAGT